MHETYSADRDDVSIKATIFVKRIDFKNIIVYCRIRFLCYYLHFDKGKKKRSNKINYIYFGRDSRRQENVAIHHEINITNIKGTITTAVDGRGILRNVLRHLKIHSDSILFPPLLERVSLMSKSIFLIFLRIATSGAVSHLQKVTG